MSMEVVGVALVVAISVASNQIIGLLGMAYVRTRSGALVALASIYALSSMFALSYAAISLVGAKPSAGVAAVCVFWVIYLIGYFYYCVIKRPAQ